jgi:hypothetical protein
MLIFFLKEGIDRRKSNDDAVFYNFKINFARQFARSLTNSIVYTTLERYRKTRAFNPTWLECHRSEMACCPGTMFFAHIFFFEKSGQTCRCWRSFFFLSLSK